MKVSDVSLVAPALIRIGLAVALAMTALFASPPHAPALTREKIIARAKKWIAVRVPYSQHRYYRGYRTDCSGFVSMAWGLDRSYTSRTIASKAKRIPLSQLKPGDVVWKPGHVSVFGGWKNRKARTYYALEQTTWGSHAMRRVRTLPNRGRALRYRGLTASSKPSSKPATTVALAPPASQPDSSTGGAASASATP